MKPANWLRRQIDLIGARATEKLAQSRVAVVGLGGVGGAVVEALARAGVGHLCLVDYDVFEETNVNRQLLATVETIGLSKVLAAKRRVLAIHPETQVTEMQKRISAENAADLLTFRPEWVVDAVDSVTAKVALIELCMREKLEVLSCMGTGNRMDANFAIGDIRETVSCGCPLARVMRRELKKRGIDHVSVLYGKDPPMRTGQRTPGSISYVPPIAGYMIAGHIIRSIVA